MVAILTEEQKELLISDFLTDAWKYEPLKNINDSWVISENEINACTNSTFSFLKQLPLIEFEPKIVTNPFI